jgi:hypothetical protein
MNVAISISLKLPNGTTIDLSEEEIIALRDKLNKLFPVHPISIPYQPFYPNGYPPIVTYTAHANKQGDAK